jgi:threonine dehydrogenase-like Zn-dependent dehydrogenase
MLGKRVVVGGAHTIFDCVGSSTSIDDALRFTMPHGTMVLVGLAAFPKGVDWTPIWLKEIQVRGSFWCSTEQFEGRAMRTYEIAVELLRSGRLSLSPLLTHKFSLDEYKQAIEANLNLGKSRVIKSVFEFD